MPMLGADAPRCPKRDQGDNSHHRSNRCQHVRLRLVIVKLDQAGKDSTHSGLPRIVLSNTLPPAQLGGQLGREIRFPDSGSPRYTRASMSAIHVRQLVSVALITCLALATSAQAQPATPK